MQPVARRTVVATAGGIAALSTLRVSPSFAADTPRTDLTLTHEGRELRRFDADLRTSLPWTAPGMVRVEGSADDARGVSVRVEWDRRLATASSSTVVAVVGEATHEVRGTLASRGDSGVLLLPLSSLAGFLGRDGTAVLALPIHPTSALEERGFDRVRRTSVTLQDGRGRGLGSAPRSRSTLRAVDGRAWAGTLSVLWAGDSGADSEIGNAARSFSHPHVVELTAAGPGPVPAGSRLRICADADSVGRLSVSDTSSDAPDEVTTSSRRLTRGGIQTLEVTLRDALPNGRTLRLEIGVGGAPRAATRTARAACSVTLVGAGPAGLQRVTGDESRALGV